MLVGFVIPAHNEQGLLGPTLDAIHQAAPREFAGRAEYVVVVADDASTDSTAALARGRGAEVVSIDARQIAAARNAGARRALELGCDRLVFVDADTTLRRAALGGAMTAIDRGAAGGGAPCRFDGEVRPLARIVLASILVLFRLLRLSGGCFLFCRADAFRAIGGFDETVYASEEILFCRGIARQGRFVVLREHVITSGRKVRAYSARELVGLSFKIAIQGRKGVQSRRGLDIWYGPRRPDPQKPQSPTMPSHGSA
ncbi:MAG: glycosyltransferase [Phycisphaerales bacterium]|nr:glycosyltransferase [Phycisphaerales bacterium]